MTQLVWDDSGNKRYETGVKKGVLYILNTSSGLYDTGFAWNGLTTVTESPAGADAHPAYADNIKYANLIAAETFAGQIDAYTWPDEFNQCDGLDESTAAGLTVGQQSRKTFGLCYRTEIGSDLSSDAGYKLHMVYGLLAAPSQKAYATINDSPAPLAFSWAINSTPVNVTGLGPTSILTADSTKLNSADLADLETLLYGTTGVTPALPMPDTVLGLFAGSVTSVTLTVPTFDGAHTITIPTETGVTYYVDGVVHAGGAQLLTSGQKKIVTAVANPGYMFNQPVVTSWLFSFVS